MRNQRHITVDRAVLTALSHVTATYLLADDALRSSAARCALPPPSPVELGAAIAYLAAQGRIASIETEEGMKHQLTDAGRLWLQEHPL